MSELPDGWVEAAVDDTGSYINGMAFKPTDWEQDGRPIIRIQNLTDPNKPLNRTTRQVEGRYIVCPGDLLVSWSATLDAFIWDREEAVLNQHIFKVEPNTNVIDPRFLFFGLREVIAEMREGEHLHGSTMKHINRGPFLAHRFPIPPLPEQRRIVAKLDGLSARTKAARAHLARVQSLATRAKQATLTAAFRDLDERTTLGEIAVDVRYGTAKKCDYESEGVPVLRIPNVANGRIDLTDLKRADFDAKELRKLALDAGDILIIRSNGSLALVGRSAVVEPEHAGLLFAGYLIRVRLDPARASARFVQIVLASSETRRIIEGYAKSTSGVNNVNSSQLASLPIPALPIEQQHKLVRRVEAAFARIDRMVEDATRAAHLLDRLDQRLLAKAFRGELVPQDPNDEPAADLLARIQAARAAAPKPKRGRRTRA